MSGRERWLLRLALLAYALGVLVYRDAIMDDTFIHLQYARHLRQSGELAFNHGEPSLGATSPLWMLLLAAVGDGVQAARLASVACGALAVLLLAALARRTLGGAAAAAATVAWAGSLWLVRHAPSGMESTAGVLLVLAAVHLRASAVRRPAHDVLFGLALAAAWLLRPETTLLAATYAVLDLRTRAGRARFAAWMPACVLPVVAWLAFAQMRTGQVLPGTGEAKSGGFGMEPLVWGRALWREARILGAGHAVEIFGILLAAGLALRLDGRAALRGWVAHALAPYGVFTLGLLAAYALFDVQVQPRYLLLVTPCVTLCGFAAWRALLGGRATVAAGVCVASLAVGVASGARSVYPATRDFAAGVRDVLVPMALEVAQHGGPGTTVATPDIGVMGYVSGARVLDLGGLIAPRIRRLAGEVGYDAMLERALFLDFGPVDYVLDRSPRRERFRDRVTRGLRWRVLSTAPVHGLGISRPETYYYTLYILEPERAYGRGRTPPGGWGEAQAARSCVQPAG